MLTECKPRHRHQEFLGFIERIDKAVPAALDVHLIVDNYSTHKHAKVRLWLAERPRFHVHYTPTYSSWLNQVERWFGLIPQQAIRRGSFKSFKDLIAKINRFTENYNQHCRPFAWTATADEKHTHAVLSSLVAAVKASGHPRTVLGPQRKAPIVLTEEVGVRLALTLVATAPISKARRIDTMLGNIDNMAVEEAYYWYAKCMGPNAGRVRKALRIFLAEE